MFEHSTTRPGPASERRPARRDEGHLPAGAPLTRRSFLGAAAPLALAAPLGERLMAAARIPAALQLYSVRADCQANFDAALEQVAAMGFEGVEFAGYYGYADKPRELRGRLDALRLKVAGTHISLDTMTGDALKKTIEFHQTIGCRFLVVPMNADVYTSDKCKAVADRFNEIAAALKPLGMACGYHNHQNEFRMEGDTTFWDLFAERTTKDVILQLDCGWAWAAGADPVKYIKKYAGRTRTAHFKPTIRKEDTGRKAILGQDSVDWKSVYGACVQSGGTEWVVLEQETYPDGKPAMECTKESFAGLKRVIS